MMAREEYNGAPSCLSDAILSALEQADRTLRGAAIAQAARTVDPDDLVIALGDEDNAIKRNAAIGALTQSTPRSMPALIRALKHKDPEVVLFTVGVLGKSRDPIAIPHLVSLIDHEEINVAQAAIDSLSQLRSTVAVEALVRALDRDPWLRFAAVHALGEIGDPRAIRALVPLLEDEIVRDAVVEALGKIGSIEALGTLATLLREATDSVTFANCLRAVADVLTNHPNEAALKSVNAWVALQSHDAADLQARLLEVLAPDGSDLTAEPDVIAAKGAAASVIRALRMRPLYTSLVLAGRHPMLRDMLQFCVVSIGNEIAPSLGLGLNHANMNVVLVACRCIGAMGLREFAPRLEALLSHSDDELRIAAIDALARLHDVGSLKTMVPLLQDRSEGVREAVRTALSSMDADAVTSVLLHAKLDPVTRRGALDVMRINPNPRQLAFIRAALADPHPDVRCAAIRALAAQPINDVVTVVEPFLIDPVLAVRRVAVGVVGRLRDARVRELLLAQIERDPGTRADAILAVAKLGDSTAASHLIEIFDRESEPERLAIIEALAELRQPIAEPLLVRVLTDPSLAIRCAAVMALIHFGTATAMSHVVSSARDADFQVRNLLAEHLPLSPATALAMERLCMDADPKVSDTARMRLQAQSAVAMF